MALTFVVLALATVAGAMLAYSAYRDRRASRGRHEAVRMVRHRAGPSTDDRNTI